MMNYVNNDTTRSIKLGYGVSQLSDIIRKAKRYMVNQDYGYYDNRRLGRVPVKTVEKILGIDNLTIQLEESVGRISCPKYLMCI